MQQFIEYLNESLPDERGNSLLYKFKKKTLDEMNIRYNEVLGRGISNQKVLIDLVISEHKDVMNDYKKYYNKKMKEKRARQRTIMNIVGSVTYIIALIVVFLFVSFTTQDWGHTWLIPVDGILIWIAYLLTLGVIKISTLKRIFHIFARILLAIDVMVVTVAVFLFCMAILHLSKSWLIVIGGIACIFIADGVWAGVTKQKLVVLNYMFYIPSVATMLYIILSAIGILSWNTGWIIIIIGLVLNVVVAYMAINKNKKYEQEVYDVWKEN